ncbi:MAG: RHS repeat domain-containing protein [Candidatus Zixiibacteriota bacterium]
MLLVYVYAAAFRNARTATLNYNPKGFLASITDPENKTVSYRYNATGRVTQIIRPDGAAIGFGYDANVNRYDSFGNIIADTNPQLNVMFGFAGGLHFMNDIEKKVIGSRMISDSASKKRSVNVRIFCCFAVYSVFLIIGAIVFTTTNENLNVVIKTFGEFAFFSSPFVLLYSILMAIKNHYCPNVDF